MSGLSVAEVLLPFQVVFRNALHCDRHVPKGIDLGMIRASKAGFLFRAPENVKKENPDLKTCETYEELFAAIKAALSR